jgi:WXG100 protein secretion system (Wss), protein YukD
MNLIVVDQTGSKSEELTMSETVPAGRLVGRVVQMMNLPSVGHDGQPLSYKFHHKRTGRQLADDETLVEAGVADNDMLRVVADITAG